MQCVRYEIKIILRTSDWTIKIDLTNAYLTVPLAVLKQHKRYLQFQLQGKTYQFQVLSFVILVAPQVFTKLIKVPASFLRRLGIRLVVYSGDTLIMNQIKREMSTKSTTNCNAFPKLR